MKPVFHRAKQSDPAGFTLVELLIVISIIGVLVALLMPAINSARESGRRAQCSNNLHQLAVGCLQHEAKYQYLPTGGWGPLFAGDPNRGYGVTQPGGWLFCILPFIDQNDLHDKGSGVPEGSIGDKLPTNTRNAWGQFQAQTPVALFICPTRRKVQTYPKSGVGYWNITDPAPKIGRSDYAANAGDIFGTAMPTKPTSIEGVNPGTTSGFATISSPTYDWTQQTGTIIPRLSLRAA